MSGPVGEDFLQMLGKDEHGKYLPVSCGCVNARFYVDLYRCECVLGKKFVKCILHGSKWFTPGRLESLGGKGSAKNWKHSIVSNKSPMSPVLGHSEDSVNSPACSQSPKLHAACSQSLKLDNRYQPDFKISSANLCNPILAFIDEVVPL